MPSSKQVVVYWVPAIAWMAAIFAVSSLQSSTIEGASGFTVPPSVAHAVEYAVLAFLLSRLVLAQGKYTGASMWPIVLVVAIGYGLSDEFHQSVVPGRVPSWQDIFYDSFGVVVGLMLAEAAARLLRGVGFEGLAAIVTGSRVTYQAVAGHSGLEPGA